MLLRVVMDVQVLPQLTLKIDSLEERVVALGPSNTSGDINFVVEVTIIY